MEAPKLESGADPLEQAIKWLGRLVSFFLKAYGIRKEQPSESRTSAVFTGDSYDAVNNAKGTDMEKWMGTHVDLLRDTALDNLRDRAHGARVIYRKLPKLLRLAISIMLLFVLLIVLPNMIWILVNIAKHPKLRGRFGANVAAIMFVITAWFAIKP